MLDVSEQSINSTHETTDQERNESTPLYGNTLDTGTLRLIVGFFFGFSVTVTAVLLLQISYGNTEIKRHGSVVSDNEMCSEVGAAILKQGGNAIDAVIAVAFCMGVVDPHITGLGSGGYMLIYDQQERKVLDTIDFRNTKYSNDSVAGVPGFVAGMALAHQLHGVLPWHTLITPAEYIARSGYRVSPTFKASEYFLDDTLEHNDNLKELLRSVQVDEVIANRDLADTLAEISLSDPMDFYRNKSKLFKELEDWRMDDPDQILKYEAIRGPNVKGSYLNYDIVVPGKGSGGPLLVNNLQNVNESFSPLVSVIDAFQNVARNVPDQYASHAAVMDINDLYVTVVSGLGTVLGCQLLTKSGYIMNNIMTLSDRQSQRPEVPLTPVFAFEKKKICGRRLILGAGDFRDVAQALVYLIRNESADINDSIEAPRVRIQTPIIGLERTPISKRDIEVFRKMGLRIDPDTAQSNVFPSINIIEKVNDTMNAHADSRGAGFAVVF